jgi:predicted nucleic acid-binding protein
MAVSPVLADSCYYIGMMRQGKDPLRALALAAASRDLAVCGVVRAEVGRALIPRRVRDQFSAAWDVMLNVPTDNRLWNEVERTAWDLDRKGRMIPLTDIIIACCALRIGAVVLTFDKHFYEVPGLRVADHLEV